MPLSVTVSTPKEIIYEGPAKSVIVPGEQGVFEILSFHKRILSRLVSGSVCIDDQQLPIRRGIVKVDRNKVIIIIERQS